MISKELLAELKQILWEDYQIQLTDSDLKLFAENLKGIYSNLIEAVRKKPESLNLLIKQYDNDKQSDNQQPSA